MASTPVALLGADDPQPVLVDNPCGRSPFLFVGDHAGNAIPAQLQNLGLDGAALQRHIAWDIGIRQLGAALAEALDASFIHQAYSRLVIDCNRQPQQAQAILALSDGTAIPGNRRLGAGDVAARVQAIHRPYHAAIAAALRRRLERDQPTVLVALHSFTPAMAGFERPWHIGILHHRGDTRFAHALLGQLAASPGLVVGDNQPYEMDGTDYTVPLHAYPDRLPYAEIEVRQDLLTEPAAVSRWCRLIAAALNEALVATLPPPGAAGTQPAPNRSPCQEEPPWTRRYD